jgi:hypothetical protein
MSVIGLQVPLEESREYNGQSPKARLTQTCFVVHVFSHTPRVPSCKLAAVVYEEYMHNTGPTGSLVVCMHELTHAGAPVCLHGSLAAAGQAAQ